MNVNVNEMDRTTDVWLTQSEAGSELVGMMLKDIYSGCKQKTMMLRYSSPAQRSPITPLQIWS